MILILKSMTCRHPAACDDCGELIQIGQPIGYAHEPRLVICAGCFASRQPAMRRYHGGLWVARTEDTPKAVIVQVNTRRGE